MVPLNQKLSDTDAVVESIPAPVSELEPVEPKQKQVLNTYVSWWLLVLGFLIISIPTSLSFFSPSMTLRVFGEFTYDVKNGSYIFSSVVLVETILLLMYSMTRVPKGFVGLWLAEVALLVPALFFLVLLLFGSLVAQSDHFWKSVFYAVIPSIVLASFVMLVNNVFKKSENEIISKWLT